MAKAQTALLVLGLALSSAPGTAQSIKPDAAYELATQAYLFAYPLVLMERTRLAVPNRPINEFVHAQVYPGPKARTVVRPNVDTLYCTAWLDLSREPIVMSVPDMGGRYYLVQMLDAWTETFSVPGTRTTGNKAGRFAIVGPGWKGTVPRDMTTIKSPTNMVWLIGRIQTNGPDDYPAVRALQAGFRLVPLSGQSPPPAARPAGADFTQRPIEAAQTPPALVAQQDANTFLSAFTDALVANPPHADDAPFVARLKTIGIVPGKPFDRSALSPEVMQALDRAVKDAQPRLSGRPATVRNGWRFSTTVGSYGTAYSDRAVTARVGLGALPREDAIYPSASVDADGQPLTGANGYVLHFAKSDLPPIKAFWSLTLYDADGYFAENELKRYAIGDRDRLQFNADGSLDVYVQHARPAENQVSNWLPAPEGVFNLTMRLYWPKPEALAGTWGPPSIQRVKQAGIEETEWPD
jgi:hypothetical protein